MRSYDRMDDEYRFPVSDNIVQRCHVTYRMTLADVGSYTTTIGIREYIFCIGGRFWVL